MPHAVHLFLEQVVHGLWNNAWFYLNGPHVLQGGPQSQDGEENHGEALRRFQELKLDTLAFPEYSEEFPHVQVRVFLCSSGDVTRIWLTHIYFLVSSLVDHGFHGPSRRTGLLH
jgi:hypothetical protein